MLIFVPGVTGRRMTELCGRVPWIGGILQSLLGAARAYRTKWKVVALALLLSLCSNSLFTLTLYAVAEGLPGNHPSLARHFVVIPLGSATGLIPLPLGGLGPFEGVLGYLFSVLVAEPEQVPNKGVIVALGYRV